MNRAPVVIERPATCMRLNGPVHADLLFAFPFGDLEDSRNTSEQPLANEAYP